MIKLKEEYLSFFLEEVQEIIDRLEQAMLSYKDNMNNNDFNQSVKRDFHTLKGDFLTYNFKKYSDYFHKVEDFWEDKTTRHATSENILNSISEIREFLRIVLDRGLEAAKTFEEDSKILDFLSTGKDKVSYDEVEVIDIDNEEVEAPKVEGDNKTSYTFKLDLKDDVDLKIEEIEQFFKFYSSMQYIKNLGNHKFITVISTNKLDELLLNLNNLLKPGQYTYSEGAEIFDSNDTVVKISNNIAEIHELKSIKVSTSNLDFLLNNIGELITKHSNLYNFRDLLVSDRSKSAFEDLIYMIEKITKDVQQEIFDMRLIPVNYLFSQFRRIVRDISKELNKDVDFSVLGESIKLDKEIIDKLSAPLKHMLKNSLDHGIETKDERKKAGKGEKGILRLELYQKGEDIVIEIFDDGRGLDIKKILKRAIEKGIASPNEKYTDEEIKNFIFKSGFSTSEAVSEISGRGVGMNVVKNNIDELSGQIEIDTQLGMYTLFKVSLPTTLTVIDGFLISRGFEKFIVPVSSIVEIVDIKNPKLKITEEKDSVLFFDESYKIFFENDNFNKEMFLLMESIQTKVAIPLEEVLDRRQFIIKKMNLKGGAVEKYLGATILSSGETVLVINPRKLIWGGTW